MIYVIRREESFGAVSHFNQFGKRHREDGPDLEYFSGPYKGSKFWRINGEYHRIGGPAYEEYLDSEHTDNTTINLKWYRNNRLHRLNAQALLQIQNKQIIKKEYWIFGIMRDL